MLVSRDGGASYTVATTVNSAATIGTTLTALPAATSVLWDRRSAVDVELAADGDEMHSATEAAVLAGANLAVIGDEILQFASATALGGRRFRLATLLRGRRGSENAVTGHVAGQRFILLDERVVPVELSAEALGAPFGVKAVGPGEDPAAVAALVVVPRGVALRPLSPATVRVVVGAKGDRVVTWQRRSRAGFAWSDGTDAPVAEDSERYRVTVSSDAAVLRTVDVATNEWTYAAVDFVADSAVAIPRNVTVAQVSAIVGAGPTTIAALG